MIKKSNGQSIRPRLSFEFFPSKTVDGEARLIELQDSLAYFNPDFYSVTYGAGGSTRANTRNIAYRFARAGAVVAPHLSFGESDDGEIWELLNDYRQAGINRIVALRGDMPESAAGQKIKLRYASQLVSFIRSEFGDAFHLEVAAYPEIHPESLSYQQDIEYLKLKFLAGADSAITQYFFNADAYFRYLDACHKVGITQPIYPGIMPIINFDNLRRFSVRCGAEIPRWLERSLASYSDDPEALKQFSVDVVSRLCESLLDNGAPGLHFYTMNQYEPVAAILDNLPCYQQLTNSVE